MRIASPRILGHILLYHLLLLLIPTSHSASYQRSSNCQQHQSRSQEMDQSENLDMGLRRGNSKQTASNIAQKAAQEAKKA
ncbi:hypothetical protein M5D96_001042 [Drosophila gunungcola]|uniref:Secreted protein n=2 Tax=Drosophila gunungcola TaxID=103775 RepID=A0A9Q0BU72_9MUSC|nr:hypothetical protein M5D96_001042 [Drosophila gunungcola]